MAQHSAASSRGAQQLVQQLVEKHAQGLGPAGRAKLAAVLQGASDRLATKLELCNAVELTRVARSAGDAARSLPLVIEDEELTTLRAQVQKAHATVMVRRQTVPASVFGHMLQLLEAARPAADASPAPAIPSAGEGVDEAAAGSLQLSPAPQQLQAQLASALPNMPELRARLSEAVGRLERVTAAAAAEDAAASPGDGSQEQQQAGAKRPAVSPAFEEALRSGKIATRRRLRDRLSDNAQRNLAAQIAAQ